MDRALCPDGMTDETTRLGLYNNMIDIAALPGRSKRSEGAASTGMHLLAQILNSEQGAARHRTNVGWRHENKDTLSKIKSRTELEVVLRS
jgi:uracil DNA glycosylase